MGVQCLDNDAVFIPHKSGPISLHIDIAFDDSCKFSASWLSLSQMFHTPSCLCFFCLPHQKTNTPRSVLVYHTCGVMDIHSDHCHAL